MLPWLSKLSEVFILENDGIDRLTLFRDKYWQQVKIWMREVYDKCKFATALNESFLRITKNHREKLLKSAADTNFANFKEKASSIDFDDEIPKGLYLSLNTKK